MARGPSVREIVPTLAEIRKVILNLSFTVVSFTLPAPVSIPEGLRGAVSSPEPGPLGQDELQLRGGPARDEGPDESQRVLVEVSLGGKY